MVKKLRGAGLETEITCAAPCVLLLGATPLCAAVAALYGSVPGVGASLCLYGGRYYLAVRASLGQRPQVRRAAAPFARELGPCPVLYAYFEEHGLRLSGDAVGELGGALHHRRK